VDLDVVLLSRLQFAFTVMFHYLFPPLTIGMGIVLVYLEGMYLRTREPIYETAAKFWTSIFAVNFAVGVASGIVMEFEFGTNWAVYSRFVGDVFGSALAAEGIFAFFLESGFLAVLVFGWDKVSPGFHFFSTVMVALGGIFSSIWIIVANSWQQTPAGHRIVPVLRNGKPWIVNGVAMMRAETADLWSVVFNPSTVNRLTHTLIGAFILGAFFIMSISAWYILKGRHLDFARRSFTGALLLAVLSSVAQLLSGHFNARMVARYQPAKLAAFEGHFQTGPADLHLTGIPNPEERRVDYSIAIPKGLSLLAKHDPSAPVIGLDRFRPEDWPPVRLSFLSYHIMVALGIYLIVLTLFASWLRMRGSLFDKRWLMWVFVFSVVAPFAANQLGWVAAEVGRQPWTVHPRVVTDAQGEPVLDEAGFVQYVLNEGLRTSAAISEAVRGEQVLASVVMFGLIYGVLFLVWVFVLHQKIQRGPEPVTPGAHTTREGFLRAAEDRVLHEGSLTELKEEGREESND
jgi:Cytochrome bd-type quinol oxidase, subunit 1